MARVSLCRFADIDWAELVAGRTEVPPMPTVDDDDDDGGGDGGGGGDDGGGEGGGDADEVTDDSDGAAPALDPISAGLLAFARAQGMSTEGAESAGGAAPTPSAGSSPAGGGGGGGQAVSPGLSSPGGAAYGWGWENSMSSVDSQRGMAPDDFLRGTALAVADETPFDRAFC